MNEERFENYLCQKNDLIDNAAFQLLTALVGQELEWNMEQIAPVVQMVENYVTTVLKRGICHPWFEDSRPCYLTKSCSNPHCAFASDELRAEI